MKRKKMLWRAFCLVGIIALIGFLLTGCVTTEAGEEDIIPSMKGVLAAGASHGLTIGVDGSLWAWGNNSRGQIGDGRGGGLRGLFSIRPLVRIGMDHDWVSVSVGRFHSVAVGSDGSLWEWGYFLDNNDMFIGRPFRTAPRPVR